jgi:heterogeneous nuclear ribonucleoprotein F/H
LGPDGRFIDQVETFKFHTGITLLDVAGGDAMGRETLPAKVLLMGPAGELYVRNELDDKEAVEYHQAVFDKKNQGLPGEGMYPGAGRGYEGGEGGRGGYGGYGRGGYGEGGYGRGGR